MEQITETLEYVSMLIRNRDAAAASLNRNYSEDERLMILMNAKKLFAYAAAEEMQPMCGACYTCKHRGTSPGDAHSCCKNPLAIAIGDESGVKHGWFMHPFNFDPVWLRYCDGYEKKEKKRA